MHPSPTPRPPAAAPSFGASLKRWRQQRRMTQIDLAVQAEVSVRHLSFVETGRSAPSREMVLRLSECLQVPLRERNQWLLAAGFAPMYRERALADDELAAARQAVQRLLTAHEPFPAMALDRHWNIVAANGAVPVILGQPGRPLPERANIIRGCYHPAGLVSRLVNVRRMRAAHVQRLRQQIEASGDPGLSALLKELLSYPEPAEDPSVTPLTSEHEGVAVPFQIRCDEGVLSFLTATTIFGSAFDITLSELSMEIFLPADPFTAEIVPRLVRGASA
ncbi:helix-turn-helix transcriptional regulator [Piscinibacter gummiphilus]|uniref:Helix-turn-helix transcriptional regulator n=1 Tax=Piscinibacter gummiphilus TaxID=946333 RepID=A0ABZ0CT66_9BURK|nr:helix-turn-helix transcriptional regulator [Piscinibacter gummiphilus]WOB08176.1 helix-turn-helix transcriptional regulator [Piscinibacter gummiphilus]